MGSPRGLQSAPVHRCRRQSAQAGVLYAVRRRPTDVPGRHVGPHGAVSVLQHADAFVQHATAGGRTVAQPEGQRGRDDHTANVPRVPGAEAYERGQGGCGRDCGSGLMGAQRLWLLEGCGPPPPQKR